MKCQTKVFDQKNKISAQISSLQYRMFKYYGAPKYQFPVSAAVMTTKSSKHESAEAHLLRRFGLVQATALNMSNMIGVGPFITIPLLMSALGGPQAMLGWVVAVLIAIADGMVWSELGAAMPGSGGSYIYLREAYGRETFGRLMAFLFIWQFILSGPLEIASVYIVFARYTGYIWHGMTGRELLLVEIIVCIINIAFVYRRIILIG